MQKKILYASNNPSKQLEVGKYLSTQGYQVVSPKQLGLDFDVAEDAKTLKENSLIKAKAYFGKTNLPILADDSGLEIDALNGEPGARTKRWKGHIVDDHELIAYLLERMQNIPDNKRTAQFHTVLTYLTPEGQINYFEGILKGRIQKEANWNVYFPNFPFYTVLYIPEWKMLLGEAKLQPAALQAKMLTHREIALRKLVEFLK